MKLRLNRSTTIVSVSLAVVGLLAVSLFMTFSTKSVQAQAEGGRLITVHDRGTTKDFITDEDTLKDALKEEGIRIDDKDAVEPSIEEKLVAADYQVNIYRARPVTVIDGATRQRVVTPYQSAERIVEDTGIELYDEDTTDLKRSNDIVSDGAGLQLVIDRAVPLTLNLYGTKTKIRTQGETLSAMLKEKGIELGENGRVSVSMDSASTPGMEVRIWREGKQTITVKEDVAFETKEIKDADRPVGYKAIQTAGVNGERSVTYEIEIKDGVEVSRTEIASLTITAPVKQVEIVGAKQSTVAYTGGGSKSDWLAASNIPEQYWGYADFMVQKESSWNPNAVNSSSGACGLAQALPCSKLGPDWNNPVVALNWMNNYVNGRYGSWENAYSFWQVNRWY